MRRYTVYKRTRSSCDASSASSSDTSIIHAQISPSLEASAMPTNTASQRKSVHHPKAPAGNDHSRAHHPPAPAGNDHSRPAHRSDDTLFADDERRKRARVEDSSDGRHDDDDDEDEDEEEDEEECVHSAYI